MKSLSAAEESIFQKLRSQLSPDLTYHGLHHTLDVLKSALRIAESENLTEDEIRLLRIAVLYHDAGFINVYKEHEKKGCEMARKNLKSFGFTQEETKIICGMIMATKIPQKPSTKLEKIICDADLDYLGRKDFYKIGNMLYKELMAFKKLHSEQEWNNIQKIFLENHQYHTEFGRCEREPQKQKYLDKIRKKTEKKL